MLWTIPAGILAGLILGYLGAGGTIIGLPFVLFLMGLPPHTALGTNALGVSLIAIALLIYRLANREVLVKEGLLFAIPGIAGDFAGVRVGLIFPGQRLIFLLGILLFLVAGWMFYLSTRSGPGVTVPENNPGERKLDKRHVIRITITAFVVGATAGFFAVGGGFMIVPGLILAGGLELGEAAAASLIPIALFSGWIGLSYLTAGEAALGDSLMMLAPGILGGVAGVWLGQRLSKRTTQRIFAAFLIGLGFYMSFR